MLVDKYRYVVVEGPIGVGKTSLTLRLAEHSGATALLEKPEENPFLTHFYQDPARHALPTQLFFLFQRINEVRDLAQMDLFRTSSVADYLFDKDALFARLNLSDDEFALYQNIYRNLAPQAPPPARRRPVAHSCGAPSRLSRWRNRARFEWLCATPQLLPAGSQPYTAH